MSATKLSIELLSDTTFGRGERTAGEVDVEVEHDEDGIPYVGGKTVHGLLRDAWLTMAGAFPRHHEAAARLLGRSQELHDTALLRVGDAHLDATTRAWIRAARTRELEEQRPGAWEVLRAFTTVRRQTAQERTTGAPARSTLRATRVVLRGITFEAPLLWLSTPDDDVLRCLALCALGVRHGGLSRNRGRGHLRVLLDGNGKRTQALAREALR